jgi:hypothetical protein
VIGLESSAAFVKEATGGKEAADWPEAAVVVVESSAAFVEERAARRPRIGLKQQWSSSSWRAAPRLSWNGRQGGRGLA